MSLPHLSSTPVWRPAPPRHRLPDAVADWLLEDSSLTRRLQRRCGPGFNVRLLRHTHGRVLRDEARALGIPRGLHCLIREVELCCGGSAWVAARTLIPVTTLRAGGRRLKHLGTRPLGALLFADPHVVRGPLEVTRIPADPFRSNAGDVWGRRSLFRLAGRPLLVCEYFLPALLESEE